MKAVRVGDDAVRLAQRDIFNQLRYPLTLVDSVDAIGAIRPEPVAFSIESGIRHIEHTAWRLSDVVEECGRVELEHTLGFASRNIELSNHIDIDIL